MGKKSRQKKQKRQDQQLARECHPSILLAVAKLFVSEGKTPDGPDYDATCTNAQKQLNTALAKASPQLVDFPPIYVQSVIDSTAQQGNAVNNDKILELCIHFAKYEKGDNLQKGAKPEYYGSKAFLSSLWAELETLKSKHSVDKRIAESIKNTEGKLLQKITEKSGALTLGRFNLILEGFEKELNLKIPKPYLNLFYASFNENTHRLHTKSQIDAFLAETKALLTKNLELIIAFNRQENADNAEGLKR